MRSQVSLEYLVLLSLVIIIIIPLVGLFYVYVSDSIKIAQARDAVRKIADSVEYVSYGGPGTLTYVYVNFPDGINTTFVGNHTIMLKLQTTSGIEEVYEDVDANVIGYLHDLKGYRSVRIINFGNIIQIGQGLLFNPSPIYFELSKGSTVEKTDTITNLLSQAITLNYSLSGDNSSWVSIKNFPNQLNANESKDFEVNVSVPSNASGKYEVDLIAKSDYSYEELPIIINIVGELKHLLINFYSDASYTHEVNKFFPGDTVYYKISTFDDENNPINSSINYNLTNPSGIIKKSGNEDTDVLFGSYTLSNNWNEVHGIWNLSSIANKSIIISNSSTFEVKASLPIKTTLQCSSVTNTTVGNKTIKQCTLSWWNSSWKYKRWINITESNGRDEINVPIPLTLNGSNIDFSKTNGSDLRFIFNGEEIPYWIESWNSNTESAIVWIKLPYLHAYSTDVVWVYYGNPNANSESNESAVLFYDNMEHGSSNWNYNGLWHITTRRSNSPTHSFWYGNESTGNYDTGDVNSGNLTTKHWIHLYDNAYLIYWQYRETEESKWYDHAWVKISTDNSSWTTIDNSYNDDSGSTKIIDLSSYANEDVLVQFYFDTVDPFYNDYEGWYIDDFTILTYPNEDIKIESDAFWWNQSWENRIPIKVDSSNDLSDYQTKFDIPYELGMKTDYSDLRFVYWNGTANIELPYWIENYNSSNAIVWVKTNLTDGNNLIYLYYNNPNANSMSNGSKVFIFFDDFENFNGWMDHGSGKIIQSSFSYSGNYSGEKTTANDPNGGYKDIGKTIGRDIILEGEVFRNTSWDGGNADRIGLIDNSGNGYGFYFAHASTPKLGIDVRSSYSGSKSSTNVNYNPKGEWYHFELDILSQSNEIISKYNSSGESSSYSTTDNSYSSFTRVYIFGGYDYLVDNLRIREYTSDEPTYTIENIESFPKDIVYWNINLLDQNDNPKIGNFNYAIYRNSTIYQSQNGIHSSSINGSFILNQSFVGNVTISANWTDILLFNSTMFEVVK